MRETSLDISAHPSLLALNRSVTDAHVVLVEEPENH
jgi:hypothetical protein